MASQGEKLKQTEEQAEELLLRYVEPRRAASLLRLYGAPNIFRILQGLPLQQQRKEAIESMVDEAEARDKDPVFGSVGTIRSLLDTIQSLQTQIVDTQDKIVSIVGSGSGSGSNSTIHDDGQDD